MADPSTPTRAATMGPTTPVIQPERPRREIRPKRQDTDFVYLLPAQNVQRQFIIVTATHPPAIQPAQLLPNPSTTGTNMVQQAASSSKSSPPTSRTPAHYSIPSRPRGRPKSKPKTPDPNTPKRKRGRPPRDPDRFRNITSVETTLSEKSVVEGYGRASRSRSAAAASSVTESEPVSKIRIIEEPAETALAVLPPEQLECENEESQTSEPRTALNEPIDDAFTLPDLPVDISTITLEGETVDFPPATNRPRRERRAPKNKDGFIYYTNSYRENLPKSTSAGQSVSDEDSADSSPDRQKHPKTYSRASKFKDSSDKVSPQLRQTIREIFNKSQEAHNLNDCLEQLGQIEFVNEKGLTYAYSELRRCILFILQGDERSPYTSNSIIFLAKYLTKQWRRDLPKEPAVEGEEPPKSPFQLLLDWVLEDLLIPNFISQAICVRYNICVLIKLLYSEIEYVDKELYHKLKQALIYRLSDKNSQIREQVVQPLHLFVEDGKEEDSVMAAFLQNLKIDPELDVRAAILEAIEINSHTLPEILSRLRDPAELIRKIVYEKIAEHAGIQTLTIEQRTIILHYGLRDKDPTVKKAVENVLLPNWLKSRKNDLEEFLQLLNLETETETCEILLKTLFTVYLNSRHETYSTKFHNFVAEFSEKYLDTKRLLTKKKISAQNSFIWRSLVKFAKEKNINAYIENEQDNENAEVERLLETITFPDIADEIQIESENVEEVIEATTVEGCNETIASSSKHVSIDPLSMILPDLPHFCSFIKKYVEECIRLKKTPENCDFIYAQLTELLLLSDITEETQRRIFLAIARDILFMDKINDSFTDVPGPLLNVIGHNVFKSSEKLLVFSKELTQEIHNKILGGEEEEAASSPIRSPPKRSMSMDTQHLDLEYAKVGLEIEEIRDEIDKALEVRDYALAEQVKIRLNDAIAKRDNINQRKFMATSQEPPSDPPARPTAAPEADLSQHPKELLLCLQIFISCLKFGQFSKFDSFILSHLEKIVYPGILCEDLRVRNLAVKAVGLCAYISADFAKNRLALFLQVLSNDVEQIRVTALKAIFDFLCQHGIQRFVNDENLRQIRDLSKENTNSKEDDTITLDKFIELLTDLITKQLESDIPTIQYTAIEGVAKLLLLGRISSPILILRILKIWLSTNVKGKTKKFLECFVPYLTHYKEECVKTEEPEPVNFDDQRIKKISTVYWNEFDDENPFGPHLQQGEEQEISNVLEYLKATVTNEAMQVRFLAVLLDEISGLLKDHTTNEKLMKVFMRILSTLPITITDQDELNEIEKKLTDFESKIKNQLGNQVLLKHIQTFAQRIKSLLPSQNGEINLLDSEMDPSELCL